MAGMIGQITRGVVAGVAGTLAMDLLWWSRHRRSGEYDADTLAQDLSAHLLFGATTGLAYAALATSGD